MRRTAILTGCQRPRSPGPLDSPHADIYTIERVLKANGYYVRVKPLLEPGRNEAPEALEAALSEGKPDDLQPVSFSGHGVKTSGGGCAWSSGTRAGGSWRRPCCRGRPQTAVGGLPDVSQVLLLNCCHGGAFADSFVTRSDGGGEAEPLHLERELSVVRGPTRSRPRALSSWFERATTARARVRLRSVPLWCAGWRGRLPAPTATGGSTRSTSTSTSTARPTTSRVNASPSRR
ncbi:caspase family protein [Nocardiopsis sp. SBT366]|uniref:caspase family protein n=1 Tax=Nocardiopsis sp. SBT366 TaxID=1580529 RepID=UPI000A5481D7|nr:caspase family protein [Nocardiopsis sp. SBT366]